jgi:hypothetical protein
MSLFVSENGIISKNNSVISGSLLVNRTITGSLFGTASYVNTSSYSLTSGNTLYTYATTADSASYSLTSVTAGLAQTTSFVNGLYYGPNSSIGYLSPNIYIGTTPSVGGFNIVVTSSYNGTFLTPILINKPCTLVTMSIAGGASNNTTCSIGLYSNSTTLNLPEYLLAEGTFRSSVLTTPRIFHTSNFTPVKLLANTVYWVAFLTNAAGAFTAFRFLFDSTFVNLYSFNPLLGNRISTGAAGIISPHWCIRSGSIGVGLAATASQATSSYGFIALSQSCAVLPVLKVTYP